jgi:hypothetical protein
MMAVEGIGNLTQNFTEQLAGQPAVPQAAANAPPAGSPAPAVAAAPEDTFTPSSQANAAQAAAQDSGIFQVGQGTLGAVGASLLFAQANAAASQNGIPAQAAPATAANAGNAQPAAPANVIPPVTPGQLFTPAPAGQAPPAKATPTTNLQEEILVLNAQLPALGLSKVEIQQIDNLATQLQNFNPGAYTILIDQYEALAQQSTQQSAQNSAANASSGNQNSTPGIDGTGNGTQS